MYFESHAHYDDVKFDNDRRELLERLTGDGIGYCINVGADMQSSQNSIAISEQYSYIFATVGVHPHEVHSCNAQTIQDLEAMASHKRVVAIGEIGLDLYYDLSPRNVQRHWFSEQLALASRLKLPVVIHSRDAAEETFNIIKASNIRQGVIHCYSGSAQMAEAYVALGFMIGVGGAVTFKNNRKLVETVERIPLENILIETDSPYLSPVPKRGERNDSTNLIYITEKIASIKDLSTNEVENVTYNNALRLFEKIK